MQELPVERLPVGLLPTVGNFGEYFVVRDAAQGALPEAIVLPPAPGGAKVAHLRIKHRRSKWCFLEKRPENQFSVLHCCYYLWWILNHLSETSPSSDTFE